MLDIIRKKELKELFEIDHTTTSNSCLVGECSICRMPNMLMVSTPEFMAISMIDKANSSVTNHLDTELISVVSSLPKLPIREDHDSWPAKVRELYAEALAMIDRSSPPSIIIGVCRSLMDIATKELDQSTGTLNKRIDALQQKGVLTINIAEWAHTVRLEGNAAVHEAEGTSDDAKELVSFIRLFLSVAFTLPDDISKRRERNSNSS